jgi:hypothetical protein
VKVVVTARVDPEIAEALEWMAGCPGASRSAVIEDILRRALGPDPVRRARIARLARMNEEELGMVPQLALRQAIGEVDGTGPAVTAEALRGPLRERFEAAGLTPLAASRHRRSDASGG